MTHRSTLRNVLTASLLATLALTGCKHREDITPEPLPGMTAAQMQTRSGELITEGRRLRDEGIALRAQGKDGGDLIKQGEQKLAEGQQMRDQAMMLK